MDSLVRSSAHGHGVLRCLEGCSLWTSFPNITSMKIDVPKDIARQALNFNEEHSRDAQGASDEQSFWHVFCIFVTLSV
jgi:hypothetical protein